MLDDRENYKLVIARVIYVWEQNFWTVLDQISR